MNHIKAIIGLGNPGPRFFKTRHNIGFRVIDEFAMQHGAQFQTQGNMELATINFNNDSLLLIKPQTFMNDSGAIAPFLQKKGIKPEEVIVIHDELELPFGTVKTKRGGSAKGHNGLRSLITKLGSNFYKVRCGIGRPAQQSEVPDFVLASFKPEEDVEKLIQSGTHATIQLINELQAIP